MVGYYYYTLVVDQTRVDLSPLRWGVLWKGAMWAEFQRYNAGMGRYQSTHCIDQDGDQAPSQRWPQYILYSGSSCQLVEPWRWLEFWLWKHWMTGYLSDQWRNQISTVWEWRAANCQYESRKQGGKTSGGTTSIILSHYHTITVPSPPHHTIIIT